MLLAVASLIVVTVRWSDRAAPSAELGRAAPDIELERVASPSSELRLSEWRGSVVLLDVRAPLCEECAASLRSLARLQDSLETSGLRVVRVAWGQRRDRGRVRMLYADEASRVAVVMPSDVGAFFRGFVRHGAPVVLILNRQGVVVWTGRPSTALGLSRFALPPDGLAALDSALEDRHPRAALTAWGNPP